MKTIDRRRVSIFCLLAVVCFVLGMTGCTQGTKCVHQWGEWSGTEATCTEAGVKERICSLCGDVETFSLEATGHDWNEGTCSTPKTCKTCGETEGLAAHIPNADDGDCTTAILCSVCGEVTTEAKAAHTGGEADCEHRAECSVCGQAYGELSAHLPNADDGDCTTAILCSVCGEVTTEAKAAHTGGEADCEHRAECSVCGQAYGELAEHTGESVWVKHLGQHYRVYSCCYTPLSDPEGHTMLNGACTECGFKPTVAATSVEVTPDDTEVTVAISVKDNPGITGLMITLQYNADVFTLREAASGEALNVLTFTAPGTLQSGCTFLWDGVEIRDKDIKDGEALILTFDISSDAPEGTYRLLLKVTAYDNELHPFTLTIEGGDITIQHN